MVFESILNPVLSPLLKLPLLWSLILVSFLISLLITLVYKWMTDQKLMKTLKDDLKGFQKEMKDFKEDQKKVMEIQKKAMETNMKYMMHSMKPTLITFIPLIIIFGWLNANMAYEPIMPATEFTTTAVFEKGTTGVIELKVPDGVELIGRGEQNITDDKAQWKLKGSEGNYLLEYIYDSQSYNHELMITNAQAYKPPVQTIKNSRLKIVQTDNKKVVAMNLFGWKVGWLGTYIIFSLIFSIGLRKLLKLH